MSVCDCMYVSLCMCLGLGLGLGGCPRASLGRSHEELVFGLSATPSTRTLCVCEGERERERGICVYSHV